MGKSPKNETKTGVKFLDFYTNVYYFFVQVIEIKKSLVALAVKPLLNE